MDPAGGLEPALLSVGLLAGGFWDWEPESSTLEAGARDALERVPFGADADAFESPPQVSDVAEVNAHRDGDPIYVPVIDVDLALEEPDLAAAYRITGAIVRALRPVFAEDHVRHYDVVFAYGERAWRGFGEKEKRRIAVTPDLVERLDREPSFDDRDLRREIEDRDDGDDEIPPVAWGEPLGHSYYTDYEDWGTWGAFGGFP